MSDTSYVIDAQLLQNCLYAFNAIPNKKVHPGFTTYDLASQLGQIVSHKPTSVHFSWGIEDVQSIREDLSDEKAMEVLQYAKQKHDATLGINWEVLQIYADTLFPTDTLESSD